MRTFYAPRIARRIPPETRATIHQASHGHTPDRTTIDSSGCLRASAERHRDTGAPGDESARRHSAPIRRAWPSAESPAPPVGAACVGSPIQTSAAAGNTIPAPSRPASGPDAPRVRRQNGSCLLPVAVVVAALRRVFEVLQGAIERLDPRTVARMFGVELCTNLLDT